MRAFIAIEIPEDVRAKLAQVSENLEKSGLIYGTFVNKDNIHLTLKFLWNEIGEEDIEKIKKAFLNFKFKPFESKVKGVGFFPSDQYVKIVWAGVEGKELEELEKNVGIILNELKIKTSDDFEFHGHLTIARIKEVKNKELFQERIRQINIKPMNFNVNSIHLFKSELTSRGPIYKKLASFKFS